MIFLFFVVLMTIFVGDVVKADHPLVTYTTTNSKYCYDPRRQMTSSTLDEAKEECSNDPTCTMFYRHCPEGLSTGGDDYQKCNVSSVIRSSACGSIVYTKGLVTIDCDSPYDTEVTTPGTLIQSPNYPSSYEPEKDCRTTITFSKRILLRFLYFDVEEDSNCDYDYLIIYDGPDDSSSQIGTKLCGNTNPTEIESSGTTIHILFHTDSSEQRDGFQIQVLEFGYPLTVQGARDACNGFGSDWMFHTETSASLSCTKAPTRLEDNYNDCGSYRILVWEDGADDFGPNSLHTLAGHYYGGYYYYGHYMNHCGVWSSSDNTNDPNGGGSNFWYGWPLWTLVIGIIIMIPVLFLIIGKVKRVNERN